MMGWSERGTPSQGLTTFSPGRDDGEVTVTTGSLGGFRIIPRGAARSALRLEAQGCRQRVRRVQAYDLSDRRGLVCHDALHHSYFCDVNHW